MKTKIPFSKILLLLALTACNKQPSQPSHNDLILENLSGKVMSINEISYKAKETYNGVIEGPRERPLGSADQDHLKKYNIEGYLEQEDRFFSGGTWFEKIEYIYNDLGNNIE